MLSRKRVGPIDPTDPTEWDAPRVARWLLMMILGIGFGLRVWGLGFGLPYDLTYDEVHEIVRAFKLGAGEYDWKGFGKGGLYFILFIEYGVLYAIWWLLGQVSSAHDFALAYLQDPSAFYLAGRLTVAVMGTLTCWIVFRIGQRVYHTGVGIGAAFLGAIAYYHGMWSHYINVDIGMTLALWASVLVYLRYEASQKYLDLLGAAALGAIAIAFKLPGAIILFVLYAAIVSRLGPGASVRKRLQELIIVGGVLLVILTVISPEWIWVVGEMNNPFSRLLEQRAPVTNVTGGDMGQVVDTVTRFQGKKWFGYIRILFLPHNALLTVAALLGMAWGVWHRHRWTLICSVLIIVFVAIMSGADRGQSERYLVPLLPAFWLLGSQLIFLLSNGQTWRVVAGFACVAAIPLATLVYKDYMWTQADTRLLAKKWIEQHVPSDAKILIDGMRYRLVQSPPLKPNKVAVDRRVTEAAEATHLSRGVSGRTLALYTESAERMQGPVYDLHSTSWGLEVKELAHYVQTCFDYIVTSSLIADKFKQGVMRTRFPRSAQFYDQLPADTRFQVVYEVAPVPWQSDGPQITVYKVVNGCQSTRDAATTIPNG